MKKELFKLIREEGYEFSYSGITSTLYIRPSTSKTNRIPFEELREKINDLVQEKTEEGIKPFFKEVRYLTD